ncbi:MAG: response regulator [Thermodesulfobacteriota bacterium]
MAKILVVDDEPSIRDLLQRLLADAGHAVRTAADGEEALTFFQQEPADLVIVDLIMPRKDGLNTIVDILEASPNTGVIAISGGGQAIGAGRYLRLAQELGAVHVLSKPLDMLELFGAIDATLARRSSGKGLGDPGVHG